jgi:hypothetical protein
VLIDLCQTRYISTIPFTLAGAKVGLGIAARTGSLWHVSRTSAAFTELFIVCPTRDEGMLKAK